MTTTLFDLKSPDAIGEVVTFSFSSKAADPVMKPVNDPSLFFLQRVNTGTPAGGLLLFAVAAFFGAGTFFGGGEAFLDGFKVNVGDLFCKGESHFGKLG